MKITLAKLPKNWSESPKGCWAQHPGTREICQLSVDGHKVHKRRSGDGIHLECWSPEKPSKPKHLEDVDFQFLDPIEMIDQLKSWKRPNLEPLIRLVAQGYAYDKANYAVRFAFAEGEREAEKLVKERSI